MKRVGILLIGLLITYFAFAQKRMTRDEYLNAYKNVAMRAMVEYKIPASIKLAQAVLESDNGNSQLSKKSNNHFGIKCHSSWKGKKTYHDDDKKQECFRVYKNVYESFADHSKFLKKPRYAKCFELKITDYKGWAKALKKAGYATNPKYPALLIKIIEDNKLYEYDKLVVSGKFKNGQVKEKPVAENKKNKTKQPRGRKGKKSEEFNEIDLYNQYNIKYSDNKIKFVKAKKGDTPEAIARRLELGPWQIKWYNNVKKNHTFKEGETVYIQPKKSKAKAEYHIVKKGETIWDISQQYGIKIKSIYRKNRMKKGAEIKAGMKLYLRKKKPKS